MLNYHKSIETVTGQVFLFMATNHHVTSKRLVRYSALQAGMLIGSGACCHFSRRINNRKYLQLARLLCGAFQQLAQNLMRAYSSGPENPLMKQGIRA